MKDDDRRAILARRALFVSAALSATGVSVAVRAQPAVDDGVPSNTGTGADEGLACAQRAATLSELEVAALTGQALEQLENGEPDRALELAEQAWQGSGARDQKALLLRGQAFQALGRNVAAKNAYWHLIECHSPDESTRALLAARLTQIAGRSARLKIHLLRGPRVFIDGQLVEDGQTVLELEPGGYLVTVEFEGALCSSTNVQLAPASVTVIDSEYCPGAAPQVCLSPPPPQICLSPPPPLPRFRRGLRPPGIELGVLGWSPVRESATEQSTATPVGGGARVYATYGLSEELAWQGGGVILVGDRSDGVWMPMGFSTSLRWLPGPLRFALGAAAGYAFSKGEAAGFFFMPEATPIGVSLGRQAGIEARVSLPFNDAADGFGLDSVATGLWFSWVLGGGEDEDELMAFGL